MIALFCGFLSPARLLRPAVNLELAPEVQLWEGSTILLPDLGWEFREKRTLAL